MRSCVWLFLVAAMFSQRSLKNMEDPFGRLLPRYLDRLQERSAVRSALHSSCRAVSDRSRILFDQTQRWRLGRLFQCGA